jgi:hypothetical protein
VFTFWGGDSCNFAVHISDMQFLMAKYGMFDVAYWNRRWPSSYGEIHTSKYGHHAYGSEWQNMGKYNEYKDRENSERESGYKKAKSAYEAMKTKAESVQIPSTFDGFIDKVNEFLKRLI